MRTATKVMLFIGLACLLAACPGKKKPKYPDCDGDKDCKAGEKCFNKKCAQCAANSDCPAGQQCTDGACEAIPGYCNSASDCAEGQICQDHKCAGCTDDSQCADTTGGKCIDGLCRAKDYCKDDSMCPEDEDCVDNVCQKKETTTTTPTQCNLDEVYFSFDDDSLTDQAQGTLNSDADCIKGQADKKVEVDGMADPRGTVEYNMALSDRRAQSVINYLTKQQIPAKRFKKVPLGKSKATGTDEDSWQHDRRVELQWR